MISRLLLVGMVGVLGISLPDGASLGRGLTPPRTDATPCACRRETVTFEPVAVDGDSTNRIADELNRQSEGLDLPMVPASRVATVARPVVIGPVDIVEKIFVENRVWGEATTEVVASSLPPTRKPRPSFEPIAVAEGAPSVADELNRASEGIDLDPAALMARTPRRPSFEPIAVVDGASSVADELNRASEGLAVARDAEPTIGTALRLTHDAALAWINVLTKTMSGESASR
jgi:hypothetical protein